jgi:hypothetical protein
MNRDSATQVRQAESGASIAAINSSEQGKEGVILGYGQKLAVAQGPVTRREVACKHSDLANKWF